MDFRFQSQRKPFGIIILDGWGIAPAWGGNAIAQAKTRCFDDIWKAFPSTSILASGAAVGLPVNSPGNSEAGHLNIGAGKVVHQDITLIDQKISDQTFFTNEVLLEAVNHSRQYNSSIHVMGLLSKAGIHSHIKHLYTLLDFLKKNNVNKVFIHLFSDGRDSDPMSGIEMVDGVENELLRIGIGQISSISGRYFAMDRDNRWGRISRTYNMLTKGEGNCYSTPKAAFSSAYTSDQTDEFIEPRMIVNQSQGMNLISSNDSIIFFNFRSDRAKELTSAFMNDSIPEFPDRVKLNNLFFASFVIFEENNLAKRVFQPEPIEKPLAKIWSERGLSQYHTAETEKYPHVTYFINGGSEVPYIGEKRLMIPSPRNVRTYDLKPQMSAPELAKSIVSEMQKGLNDGYIINFANADMVGHTGNIGATIQAVEAVDECLEKVLGIFQKQNGVAIVIADHGNAEQMVNPRTGYPDTEHTTNPVPFIIVSDELKNKQIKLRSDGILASVTPTMLEIMNIPTPPSIVNQSLIINEII